MKKSFNTQDIQNLKRRFGIIGNSEKLNHAIEVATQVAGTEMTVLITGESGTGKESFSKIIHQLSHRKHGPFIAVNCGAIPEGTIDSELFGHEKGAFTGAQEARKGYFEVTNGGTIFLDEIGEMPMSTQARLLRILEYGEYIRVGSSKVQKTDVRIVAATNKDLSYAIEKGKFREDLYYRLSTVPIYVPPLRERDEDIELLFRKFATDYAEKYNVDPIELEEEAKSLLYKFSFPGNIRQLKNIVEQMSVLETERTIDKETFLKYIPENQRNELPARYGDTSSQYGSGFNDYTERDILFRILFDLRKDFNELKSMFYQFLENPELRNQIINEHPDLFNKEYGENIEQEFMNKEPLLLKGDSDADSQQNDETNGKRIDISSDSESEEDDTYVEAEDESLSIQEKEKELILKALRKNHNKRKLASKDLGISERTLYRKLKEYGIENG